MDEDEGAVPQDLLSYGARIELRNEPYFGSTVAATSISFGMSPAVALRLRRLRLHKV